MISLGHFDLPLWCDQTQSTCSRSLLNDTCNLLFLSTVNGELCFYFKLAASLCLHLVGNNWSFISHWLKRHRSLILARGPPWGWSQSLVAVEACSKKWQLYNGSAFRWYCQSVLVNWLWPPHICLPPWWPILMDLGAKQSWLNHRSCCRAKHLGHPWRETSLSTFDISITKRQTHLIYTQLFFQLCEIFHQLLSPQSATLATLGPIFCVFSCAAVAT